MAEDTTKERLLNIIYALSEVENEMKWSSQKIIIFETAIIKLCIKKFEKENFLNFETENEDKMEEEKSTPNGQKKSRNADDIKADVRTKNATETFEEKENRKKTTPYPTMKVGIGSEEEKVWKDILDEIKKQGKLSLYTALSNSRVKFESDMAWVIVIPGKLKNIADKILLDSSNKKYIQDLVSKINKKEMMIKYVNESDENKTSKKRTDNTLGLNINIIE